MRTTTVSRAAAATTGRAAIALLCVAQFIDVLGVTVVVVALPTIRRELGFAAEDVQWVVSVYALVFGGCLLLAGRAADAFGARRLFMAGLGVFGATSLACGLAPSPLALVLARAAQGLGAAAMVPAALALLSAVRPEGPARDRAMALWTAAAAGGGAAGFVVGGVITASLGWPWVFLVNVPLALCGLALAPRLLPASSAPGARGGLDVAGAVCVTAGLLAVIYGLTVAEDAGLAGPRTVIALAGGGALLAAFLVVERRVAAPLVPLGVFRRPVLVGAATTAIALTGTTGAAAVLATAHLQQVLELSPAATGFVFLPFSLFVIAGSAAGPALVARLGPGRAAATGLLGVGAAMVLFSRISTAGGVHVLVAGLALSGACLGWASVAATGAGVAQAVAGEHGLISGVLNTATQLGTATGIAVLSTVAAARTDAAGPGGAGLVEGFQAAFVVAAGVAFAGALAAVALLPGRRSARPAA